VPRAKPHHIVGVLCAGKKSFLVPFPTEIFWDPLLNTFGTALVFLAAPPPLPSPSYLIHSHTLPQR